LSFDILPPVPLSAIGTGDIDSSWWVDATANMAARGTTIAAVGTPQILREDGQETDSGDLAITEQTVQAAGLAWSFTATAGGNVATYLVGFPLTLATGDLINRWVRISTAATLG
jgi:hypothetical protein